MKASKLSLVMLVISVAFVTSWDCRSEELQFTSPRTEIGPPSGGEASPAFYPPDLTLAVPDAPGPGVGLNQRILRTPNCQDSEIAVAASQDGRNVIVASNGDFVVSSQDGGANWTAPAAWPNGGGTTGGDPMLAVGLSGSVYLAFIWNNPAPSCDFGVSVSVNQGQNFAAPVSAVTCPPSGGATPLGCFPDQETIAADQVNPGAAGGDQIYLAWRQFTNIGCPSAASGNTDASIACSQDSGQNWTAAPVLVDPTGDRPRPAVAPDGSVYVVSVNGGDGGPVQVHRFTSCNNGLTAMAGYPYTVAPSSSVTGVPNLDRQGQEGNPMIAVDPYNSGLVYVVYGQDTSLSSSSGDPGIFLRVSTDGGVTWTAAMQVNDNLTNDTSRYFPWIAANPADGSMNIGWYDRRDDPVTNDLTAYFGARVTGGGTPSLAVSMNFRISDVNYLSSQPGSTCFSPIYGDYNMLAAGPNFMYAAWASPVSPAYITPASTDIDVLFATIVSGDIPQIQPTEVPQFGDVCVGQTATEDLEICNAGKADLIVNDITTSVLKFGIGSAVTFPLVISPDACFTIPVTYTSLSTGPDTADLIISSNDPVNPTVSLQISGNSRSAAIQTFIANSGSFGDVCAEDFHDLNLTVQNDGLCPLQINSVSVVPGVNALPGDFVEPDGSFAGTIIDPGNSLLIPIRFTPSAFDNANPLTREAIVRILSSTLGGPALPTDDTDITGVVPPPDINVAIANSGNFGNVCKGDHADLNLTLFNQGDCDLTISDISITPGGSSFQLPNDVTLPLVLSHDAEFQFPIRYAPEVCNDDGESATVVITSDDPDHDPVNITISGTSPCPNLVIDPTALANLYAFPATVVDSTGTLGCFSERSAILRNNGECPLTITNISATGADFEVIAPTEFPVLLPSGEETLEVMVRFTPQADANPLAPSEVTGQLTVISDDPDGNGEAYLCGESVAQSGVRILVTDVSSGSPLPVDVVDAITIQSKGKNRPDPINLQFKDQSLMGPVDVCGNAIVYHVDQETLPSTSTTGSNPGSSYQAKAREGNLQATESFSLGQCEFREFQLELQDSDAEACLLLPKGAACTTDGECCSGKCKGPAGAKTCK